MEQSIQTAENSPAVKPVRYLLLDTNILSRSSQCRGSKNDELALKLKEYLQELFNRDSDTQWRISISAITQFELVDQSSLKEEIQVESALEAVDVFPITEQVLRIAGRLGCFYKEVGVGEKQISSADKIIASTAFLAPAVICTTNLQDYPPPFFTEDANVRALLEYKQSNRHDGIFPIYFVIPQTPVLEKYYEQRIRPEVERVEKEKRKKTKEVNIKTDQPVSA